MSRGQQGIGISAAGMYAQLTTGKPVQIISRTSAARRGPLLRGPDRHQEERAADLREQEDRLGAPARHPGDARDRGALPEGPRLGRRVPRADGDRQPAREARLPRRRRATRGSTRGRSTSCRPSRGRSSRIPTASSSACCCGCCTTRGATRWRAFLAGDFSRVSPAVAQEICKTAKLSPDARPRNVHGEDAEALYKAIQATKIMAPPSNCISPIGEKAILHGLYKQIKGEFYTAVTRPPAVYRGNPFVIEAGLAFGKGPDQAASAPDAPAAPLAEGEEREDDGELARVIRYANRVPLLYQQSACATFKAVLETAWRNYGVAAVAGRAARRAHGGLRPHGLGLGAVHQRVEGSDRRLRRDPEGDQARAPGVRAAARRVPAAARAGQERVPPAQHLRALHRGGRRGVRAAQGRQAVEGQAQATSSRRSRPSGPAAPGPTRSWATTAAPEGLPHSIIVTPDGPEGEAPVPSPASRADARRPLRLPRLSADERRRRGRQGRGTRRPARRRPRGRSRREAGRHAPARVRPRKARSTTASAAAAGKRRKR